MFLVNYSINTKLKNINSALNFTKMGYWYLTERNGTGHEVPYGEHSASLDRFVPHQASAVWRKAPLNWAIFRLNLEEKMAAYKFIDWWVWFL